jgi:hypothetical protein
MTDVPTTSADDRRWIERDLDDRTDDQTMASDERVHLDAGEASEADALDQRRIVPLDDPDDLDEP